MPPKAKAVEKDKNQHIQVAVRLRPINGIERKQGSYSVVDSSADKKEITVKEKLGINPNTKTFNFDHVFPAAVKQIDVYKSIVTPIIDEVLMGYNCTIFAYGQTGTGKTYTMEGERTDDPTVTWEEDPLAGIIPRAMKNIFDVLQDQEVEFSVRVSFLELYNEELFDLLGSTEDTLRLRIYEDSTKKGSIIIQGLDEIVVRNKEEVYEILERGASRRQTAATLMNAHSSRSHSVFSVTIHIKENTCEGEELLKTGKLHLVDLAGSENIGRSGAVDKRAREAGNINQSLLTLGRVITALVEHAPHVPYRESKLTRLLQDSLGGRTKTSIIATISPASCNLEETLSTLDYAHRAKNITNRPEINQKLTKRALIKEYTEEIEKLRRDLQAVREKNGIYLAEENYNAMQAKIAQQGGDIIEMEEQINVLTEEMNKLMEVFSETKKELEVTTEQLTVTTDNLIKTAGTLKETKQTLKKTVQERDEQQYLVSEHVKTENCLYTEATDLLTTVESATSDVEGLHAKLDRKKKVEEQNEQCQSSFQERFHTEIQNMENMLKTYTENQRTCHNKHADHLSNTLKHNTDTTDTLVHRINELRTQLSSDVDKMNTHHKQCNAVSLTWSKGVVNAVKQRKEAEMGRASEFHQTVFTAVMTSVLTSMQSNLDSLAQLVEQIKQQKDDQLKREHDWVCDFHKKLDGLGSLVCSHVESQEAKIQQLQQSLALAQETEAAIDKEMEEKLKELQCLRTRRRQVFEEFSQKTSEDTADRLTSATSLQNEVNSFVSASKCSTDNHCEDVSASLLDTCRQTGEKLQQASDSISQCKSSCTELQESTTQSYSASQQVWEKHICDLEEKVELQCTTWNTDLNTHYHQADSLLSNHQKEVEAIISTAETGKSELVQDISDQHSQLAERLQATQSVSESMSMALNDRWADVEKFVREEMKKDVPTGTTPMRKDFTFPRDLTKTDPHDVLLENFQQEYLKKLEEEESDVPLVVVTPPTAANSAPNGSQGEGDSQDRLSDDGSVASYVSTTSGISATSGYSAFSDVSRASECKENQPQKSGRPIGALRKRKVNYNALSKNKNNVNTTPRGKGSRLPLKNTTVNSTTSEDLE